MIVYFLRHASAGERKSDSKRDEKRPLDSDGIEQCRYMGAALAAMDTQIDALVSSPLKRATQTAALVGNEIGFDAKMQIEEALRPEASFDAFREMLRKYSKHDAILVVGHNPNLSEFASLLISDGNSETGVDLKKGAVAKLEVNKDSVLEWCLTPKIVRTIYAISAARSRPKSSRK